MTDIVERLRERHARTVATYGVDSADTLTLEAADKIDELVAVLEKIASIHFSNISAAAVAQSALDTMRVLDKP